MFYLVLYWAQLTPKHPVTLMLELRDTFSAVVIRQLQVLRKTWVATD